MTRDTHDQMLELLEWITRCPSIRGPANTTAYIISAKIMKEAKELVESEMQSTRC